MGRKFYILLEGIVSVQVPISLESPLAYTHRQNTKNKEITNHERLKLYSGSAFGEYSLLTDNPRYIYIYIYIYI